MVLWEMLDEERLVSIKPQGRVVWKKQKRKTVRTSTNEKITQGGAN